MISRVPATTNDHQPSATNQQDHRIRSDSDHSRVPRPLVTKPQPIPEPAAGVIAGVDLCTCRSKRDARARHPHVSIERRGDVFYGAFVDAERPPQRKARSTKNLDGSPKVQLRWRILHCKLDLKTAAQRETWAQTQARAIATRLEEIAHGAERSSGETIAAAIDRYLLSKCAFGPDNPHGRTGVMRPPGAYATQAKRAKYDAWLAANRNVDDLDAPKPISQRSYAQIATALYAMREWLAALGVKTIGGFHRAHLIEVERRIVTWPKRRGGTHSSATAGKTRSHICGFLASVGGGVCPAAAHMKSVMTQPTRRRATKGVGEIVAKALPFDPSIAPTPADTAADSDALQREIAFARQLLRATIARDASLHPEEDLDVSRSAPYAALLLLVGARPIEVHRLEPGHLLISGDTRQPIVHMPPGLTKTWSARIVGTDVSPALSRLLGALHAWCTACTEASTPRLTRQARMLCGVTPGSTKSAYFVARIRSAARKLGYTLDGGLWGRCRSLTATTLTAAGLLSSDQAALRAGHGQEIRFSNYVRSAPLRGDYATLEAALHIEAEIDIIIAAVHDRTRRLRQRLARSVAPLQAARFQAAE